MSALWWQLPWGGTTVGNGQVNPQDRDTHDWTKVPVVPKGDFRHKYSPALTLLGNAQNPAYAHPKLLGRCFDNVYFCGRIIGDLPARGRAPHSEERTKTIYDQEYEGASPLVGEYAGLYP